MSPPHCSGPLRRGVRAAIPGAAGRVGRCVVAFVVAFVLALGWVVQRAGAVTLSGPATELFAGAPGAVLEGFVELHNPGAGAAEVRLFVADYVFGPDGPAIREEVGGHDRSAGSWIRLGAPTVVLAPGKGTAVPYEIVVPSEPPLPGTHWALIIAEVASVVPPSLPEDVPGPPLSSASISVNTLVRYAVQVAVNVGEATGPRPRLDGALLSGGAPADDWVFLVDVVNEGDTLIVPDVRLELYGPEGDFVGSFPGTGRRMYPGARVQQSVPLPSSLAGAYIGVFIIDGGGPDVFAARFELEIPRER